MNKGICSVCHGSKLLVATDGVIVIATHFVGEELCSGAGSPPLSVERPEDLALTLDPSDDSFRDRMIVEFGV